MNVQRDHLPQTSYDSVLPRQFEAQSPESIIKLIPEFRAAAPPEEPAQGTVGDLSVGCFRVQGESEIKPDLERTPPLVPRWRIYPFYMNPPAEVPQRDECDVYLLLERYSVWRCPPAAPVVRRAKLSV